MTYDLIDVGAVLIRNCTVLVIIGYLRRNWLALLLALTGWTGD
jgi:hypothetical protein